MARLEQLDIGDQALTFGRIDAPRGPQRHRGTARAMGRTADGDQAWRPRRGTPIFHIGRLAIHSAGHDPLVVDWRAPIAEPFYRATGRDPQGLVLRRHLAIEGRRVVGLEDERFSAPGTTPDRPSGRHLGEATVRAGGVDPERPPHRRPGRPVGRSRPSPVRPDDRHRLHHPARAGRDHPGSVDRCAGGPGGPGDGKTAVALHRAAYLLYTHRFPLERQGVLVVGPEPPLSPLHRTGPTLAGRNRGDPVDGLGPGPRSTCRDEGPAEVARLKGDARMAKVIARAVRTRQRQLSQDVSHSLRRTVTAASVEDSRQVVDVARRRPGTHNARRRLVEQAVARLLADRARQTQQTWARERPTSVTAFPGYEDPRSCPRTSSIFEDFSRKVRRVPELAEALDRMWPRLSPHELLHDLFGARPLIKAAGRGVLTPDEQDLLVRPRSSVARGGGLDAGRRRSGRRGSPSAGPENRRRRGRAPQVRAHRGR